MHETQRLILRNWLDSDILPLIKINQDPIVMEFFPKLYSAEESIAFIKQMQLNIRNGFGFYACELKSTQTFIGFVGISMVNFDATFTPAVEIGWRIAKEYWNVGYATEAAQKCLEIGFSNFNLDRIVSFTAIKNRRSEHLMQKIGMTHDLDQDFNHPKLPKNHPLSLHVLYHISKIEWLNQIV